MLAEAFGAPVVLVSKLREGTLRQCALKWGVKVLVYEGGEALRFDEDAIEAAVAGMLAVMRRIGMLGTAGHAVRDQTADGVACELLAAGAGRRHFPQPAPDRPLGGAAGKRSA